MMNKIQVINRGLLLSFFLGFSVRLFPELFSYPYPIGFDTIRYIATTEEGILWHHWSEIFTKTWLLYAILIPQKTIINLNSQLTFKILSPIIYGLNTAGIYHFGVRALKWRRMKSLLASLLFSFSIASLRISWDLHRNMLGLGILLFTLSLIPEIKDFKRSLGFILLSVLTVFSHQLASMSLLSVVILLVLREMKEANKAEALRILVLSLPALIILLHEVYLGAYTIKYEIKTNIISVRDTFNPHPLDLLFLTNYLSVSMPVEHYNTYLELALHIVSLFTLLYVIWLPLTIKGFFRDEILDAWTILLLAGSFGPLIVPFASLLYWNRWMFMLVYPFTFYALNGIEKFHTEPRPKWLKNGTKGIIIATILIGILFMTLPPNLTPFYTPLTYSYLPSSMQQNTIPLQDVEDTVKCLKWLNRNMNQNSSVIVHHTFLSWAKLYLDKNQTIIYFVMNITKALEVARQKEIVEIYVIWWSQDIAWYSNIRIPENFKPIYSSGRISIYVHS